MKFSKAIIDVSWVLVGFRLLFYPMWGGGEARWKIVKCLGRLQGVFSFLELRGYGDRYSRGKTGLSGNAEGGKEVHCREGHIKEQRGYSQKSYKTR